MALYYFQNRPHGTTRKGIKINTKTHFDYICREGKYEHMRGREEDLVFAASGNMPSWAKTPGEFWEEAESHRRVNGRAYREFHMALQEEFTLEENRECVEKFLEKTHIKNEHAYSYAIHDKEAFFDHEHRNIHAHVMFSEKTIEWDRPLGKDQYFQRYSEDQKGNSVGGYKNDRAFTSYEMNQSLRETWEEIINEEFREKGMETRVSCKTLEAQREELLAQGKYQEAEELDYIKAPNLEKKYCNETWKKNIKKLQRYIEAKADVDFKDDEILKEFCESKPEYQKAASFAMAYAIKRSVRELQTARKAELEQKATEQQKAMAARVEAAREQRLEQEKQKVAEDFRNTDPYFVTTGDILDYLSAKAELEQTQADEAIAKYLSLQPELKSYNNLDRKAEDILFCGRSSQARKEYRCILEALKQPNLTLEEKKELKEERIQVGKKIAYFKKLKEEKAPVLSEIKKNLEVEKEQKTKEAKKLYGTYKFHQRNAETQRNLADLINIRKKSDNQILFQHQVPPQLTKRCKINGVTALEKLPEITTDSGIYVLYKGNGTEKITDEDLENGTLKAVRYGDNITGGSAPTYYVTFKDGEVEKVRKEKDINKRTKFYKYREKKNVDKEKKSTEKVRIPNPVTLNRISKVVDKLMGENRAILKDFQEDKEKRIQQLRDAQNDAERIDAEMGYSIEGR